MAAVPIVGAVGILRFNLAYGGDIDGGISAEFHYRAKLVVGELVEEIVPFLIIVRNAVHILELNRALRRRRNVHRKRSSVLLF